MQTKGLTLIELLMVISILSLLSLIAIPGFSGLIQQHQVRSVADDLFQSIQFARSTAVAGNQRVTLRRLDEWTHGWEVFIDRNGDSFRSNDERLLRKHEIKLPVTIHGNQPVRNYISFVGTGESLTTSGALLMGTLTLCSPSGQSAYSIAIRSGGRARIEKLAGNICDL